MIRPPGLLWNSYLLRRFLRARFFAGRDRREMRSPRHQSDASLFCCLASRVGWADGRFVSFDVAANQYSAGQNWPRYSITSSASESTLLGTAKFIALAVFILMTKRYRVGISTGRSAGFAPWKIRAARSAARSKDSRASAP